MEQNGLGAQVRSRICLLTKHGEERKSILDKCRMGPSYCWGPPRQAVQAVMGDKRCSWSPCPTVAHCLVGCVALWALWAVWDCGLYKVCPFPPTDGAPPSSRNANSCFLSPENSQLASLERSGLTVLVGNIIHRHPRALFDIHLLTTSFILLNINFVVRRNLAQRFMRTKMSVFEMSCVSNVCASFNIRS